MSQSDPNSTCDRQSAQQIRSRSIHPAQILNRITVTGILGLITLTGGWLIQDPLLQPLSVQAYTGRVDLVIDMRPGDTYDSLLRRSEAAARAAAQRSFDRDILISDVNITVVVQRNQAVVPILSLQVTRGDWQNLPDPQKWATYFSGARTLLGFKSTPSSQ